MQESQYIMQIRKHESMHACKYTSIQVNNHSSMQVRMHVHLQVYIGMQISMQVSMPICMNAKNTGNNKWLSFSLNLVTQLNLRAACNSVALVPIEGMAK